MMAHRMQSFYCDSAAPVKNGSGNLFPAAAKIALHAQKSMHIMIIVWQNSIISIMDRGTTWPKIATLR
ncbi:MAG TPA: hypothetical protein PKM65_01825 [Spirochaetota bacterium]|nr:hypothetical protein [Spirochaetota bacterium]HNT12591.1 hypothetical protein [Spirochaetota bacterium]